MALEYANSFGGYGTSQLLLDWTFIPGGGSASIVTAPAGRHGGNALQFGELGSASSQICLTLSHQPTRIAGGAFYGNTTVASNGPLIFFMNVGTELVSVRTRSDNVLQIFVVGSYAADTGAFTISFGAWYYIELMATFSNSGGFLQVQYSLRVDGNILLTGTVTTSVAVSSLSIPSAICNVAGFGGGGGNSFSEWFVQDIYVLNGVNSGITGLPNNTFMGDIIIQPIFMQADSTPLQWTPSRAGSQWNLINENPPDGDTTYIYDNPTGNVSAFVPQAIPGFTGTVQGVFMRAYARKDDEGSKSFELGVNPNSVGTFFWSPDQWVNDSYVYYKQAWDGDPNTLIPWTQATFNNSTFAVKVTN